MAGKKRRPKKRTKPTKKVAKAAPKKRGTQPRATPGEWQPLFLREFAQRGNVTKSCEAARVNRRTVQREKKRSAAFADDFKEAKWTAGDMLEAEAERRAAQGLIRKKFNAKGEPVIDPETGQQYFEREYSDTLLIFLLKATRPEKFRERHDHKHSGGVRLTIVEEIVDGNSIDTGSGPPANDPSAPDPGGVSP